MAFIEDKIGDFIIRVKNASARGLQSVSVPHTKLTHEVAKLLEKEGFLASVAEKGEGVKKTLEVSIAYDEKGDPRVHDVKRISKLSRRLYYKVEDIMPVKQGTGRLILSTPKGILTGSAARKEKVGGEVLFSIW